MSLLILIILFSLDSFLVSSAYSVKNISVSFKFILLISVVNAVSLFYSFLICDFLKVFVPSLLIKFISFITLFLLGLYNVFQGCVKKYIGEKYDNKFVDVFLDETKADFNQSNNLGFYESLVLASILSLDSLLGGISIGSLNINMYLFLFLFFVVNFTFFLIGNIVGNKIRKELNIDVSLWSGIIIIIVSIIKFI